MKLIYNGIDRIEAHSIAFFLSFILSNEAILFSGHANNFKNLDRNGLAFGRKKIFAALAIEQIKTQTKKNFAPRTGK